MEINATNLEGVFEIRNKRFDDNRGSFVKIFNEDVFKAHGLEVNYKESFYSVSKIGVLRGMHFQLPPHDHAKLVYVACGEILDVAVDIRKGSETFGRYYSTILSSENSKSIYLSKGFAHGFLTLSEKAIVVYQTSTVYVPESDAGIKWNSFGFDWHLEAPILSKRDNDFKGIDLIYDD